MNVSSRMYSLNSLDAPAGLRLRTGVDQRHAPWLGGVLVDGHGVVAHVEGHVGHVQEVVREVLLDHVALVAEAHDEVAEPVVAVGLHDVPQDRPLADLDHRLGSRRGLFRQARAETAGEDHDLHDAPASPCDEPWTLAEVYRPPPPGGSLRSRILLGVGRARQMTDQQGIAPRDQEGVFPGAWRALNRARLEYVFLIIALSGEWRRWFSCRRSRFPMRAITGSGHGR